MRLLELLVAPDTVTPGEKIIAATSCLVAILAVTFSSRYFVETHHLPILVASMGASSIMLFAVPHSPFSQPWSVFGGQGVSASMGITAVLLIRDPYLAGAVAVALAAAAMYFLRCLHPPGGATALAAVLGGTDMQQLGYQFVFTPVLLDASVLLIMAFILNNILPRRHYPANIKQWRKSDSVPGTNKTSLDLPELDPSDLHSALKQMNIFIDVSEQDLTSIFKLAARHAKSANLSFSDIQLGHSYSNGEYGEQWSVRTVVDEIAASDEASPQDLLVYRIVAGKDRRKNGSCSRAEFANWSRHEVYRDENSWYRIPETKKN